MHLIPLAFVCGLATAVVGVILSVTGIPPPKVPAPAQPPSDFNRFCHHLVYWLGALFLVKLFVPRIPQFISPLVVCWLSLGCAILTFTFVRRREPRPTGIAQSTTGTRLATAFFWWFATGFLVSMGLMIAQSDGRG